ncbi:hypothetical protein O181_052534 [Austropuccinia psidii MF-1]|uniref:Reverse transcriptase domain-containing protein n=1 Tax=Austropuccinia psidii MF-1 TaxID=1389203 RepID=A0A9Q3E0W6_9BASI|nr:hypothetical protein [Austropuccinia psidii MF-1]
MDLGVLTKVGNNEQLDIDKPVIIALHNGQSRIIGDIRALNTYTIPDRYPITRVHETLTQLSQANFITAMDALKIFHKTFSTENDKKLLRIIVHYGIYDSSRMPYGIRKCTLPLSKND